jgi:hypothetical protein
MSVKLKHMGSTGFLSAAGQILSPGQEVTIVFPQDTGTLAAKTVTGTNETIIDNPSGLGVYNEVDHVKRQWSYDAVSCEQKTVNGTKSGIPYRVTFTGGTMCASLCNLNTGETSGTYPTMDSLTILKARAANAMKPGSPPVGADLLQFIGELTDFRGLIEDIARRLLKLPSTIANLLLKDKRTARRFLASVKSLKEMTMFDFVRMGVKADVIRKLVWDPMVRDCKAIRRAVLDADRVYRRVVAGEPFVVRGRSFDEADATPITYGSSSMGNYVVSLRSRKLEVVTWARIKYVAPDLGRRDFMYHYLGLWPRASVLWELTPLSFIVDWVVDIGRWIRQFEQSPVQLPFVVLDSGYSVADTLSHTDSLIWNLHSDLTLGATYPGCTGVFQWKSYKRFKDSLIFDSSAIEPLEFGLPSLGQAGTLVELVYLAFSQKIGRGAVSLLVQ